MVGRLKKGNDEWFIEVVSDLILEAGPLFEAASEKEEEARFEPPPPPPPSAMFKFRNSELLAGDNADDNTDIIDDDRFFILDLDP